MVDDIEVKKTFVDGEDVCVIYDMVTSTPLGTTPVVEWHTVEGDIIAGSASTFRRPSVGGRDGALARADLEAVPDETVVANRRRVAMYNVEGDGT